MAAPFQSLDSSADKFSILLVDDKPANRLAHSSVFVGLDLPQGEAQRSEEEITQGGGKSEALIQKLAVERDEDELLLSAQKIPEAIRRPFELLATSRRLDDQRLAVIQSDVRSAMYMRSGVKA